MPPIASTHEASSKSLNELLARSFASSSSYAGLSPPASIAIASISILVSVLIIIFVVLRWRGQRKRLTEPKAYMMAPVMNGTGMRRDTRQTYEVLYDNGNSATDNFLAKGPTAPPAYEEHGQYKSSFEQAAEGQYLMDGVGRHSPTPYTRPLAVPTRSHLSTPAP